ncbi:hypothetical protein MNBD_GAMMA21-2415 [hydrothermal vent metagenome]|uniref:Secreted protein n=1 Tax=hydrothermal vent metagenome TaxID=652676 RepID=A0A3B1B0U4_9ZZZZ
MVNPDKTMNSATEMSATENLSTEKKTASKAIVIGGSIAGLITARVLADHFDQVYLLEKDSYPTTAPDYRKGVPQARHQHILLVKGREIFETLFPGFDQELASMGGKTADHTRDMMLFSTAGLLPRFESGIELRINSRINIDWVLVKRVRSIPNITVLEQTAVSDLIKQNNTIGGVMLDDGRQLDADLIIDAMGRGSRTPKWLKEMGYAAANEEVIDAKLGYASRIFKKPENDPADYQAVAMTPIPTHNPRGAGLWEIENDHWLLTLIGTAGNHPPTDEAGYLAFAKALADPVVFNTISRAKPVSDIYAFRGTANRWKHYERLNSFPDGYLVIGDAFCAFSPFYGQGMTSAALSATELDNVLRKYKSSLSTNKEKLRRDFFRKAGKRFASPWTLATGEDLRWPDTSGGTTGFAIKASHKFMDALMPLSTSSKLLVTHFLKITNMKASPLLLFDPRILFQLFVYWIKRAVFRHETKS